MRQFVQIQIIENHAPIEARFRCLIPSGTAKNCHQQYCSKDRWNQGHTSKLWTSITKEQLPSPRTSKPKDNIPRQPRWSSDDVRATAIKPIMAPAIILVNILFSSYSYKIRLVAQSYITSLDSPFTVTEDRHTSTVFTDSVNVHLVRTNHEVHVNI